jgi:hypothetical protein
MKRGGWGNKIQRSKTEEILWNIKKSLRNPDVGGHA